MLKLEYIVKVLSSCRVCLPPHHSVHPSVGKDPPSKQVALSSVPAATSYGSIAVSPLQQQKIVLSCGGDQLTGSTCCMAVMLPQCDCPGSFSRAETMSFASSGRVTIVNPFYHHHPHCWLSGGCWSIRHNQKAAEQSSAKEDKHGVLVSQPNWEQAYRSISISTTQDWLSDSPGESFHSRLHQLPVGSP